MLLDEIRARLLAVGVDAGGGWPVVLASVPEAPDRVVAVLELPGGPPIGDGLANPYFEIQVRGGRDDYAAARSKIAEVEAALHAQTEVTLSGTYFAYIFALGTPFPLGPDRNDRPTLALNFRAARQG